MPLSFIGYPGNKAKLAEQIFSVLPDDCSQFNYYEPFFGGGNAYLNLNKNFKHYFCADILSYAVNFFKADYDFNTLLSFEKWVEKEYNLRTKEGYYSFRAYWNIQKENTMEKNIGFVLLANHCVNHLIRFGPHGFNQGWGGPTRTAIGKKWQEYISLRKPDSYFLQRDFRDYISIGIETIIYFDPPYSGAEIGIYKARNWNSKDDNDLVEIIKEHSSMGGKYILSSIYDPSHIFVKELQNDARIIPIEKIYKSSVGKHERKNHQEIILTNL
jgi:DNA adenine methylase Dam